jgi:haloalkane dehalogenase
VDEGTGPVILLLHACPAWSFAFRNLIKDLARDHRVIAPDMIGYGLSDKPDDYGYTLDNHVDNLERLMESLGIGKLSILMHGWGATVGCSYIIRHPGCIGTVIIMNSMAFTGYSLSWRLRLIRWVPWLAEHFLVNTDLMFRGIRQLPEEIRAGYRMPFQNRRDRIAILRFITEMPCNPDDSSYESVVEIEHGLWMFRDFPVLIIWAGKDWLYTEKCLKKWMQFCPNAKLRRLPQAGRYVMEESPEEFKRTVRTFLEGHKS